METKNISSWDLSLDEVAELNGYFNAIPDIYYFLLFFQRLVKDESTGDHIPNKDIFTYSFKSNIFRLKNYF